MINLVGESLRLLGNTFVALSDLRCNLACAPPRHLHVVRPMSHYPPPLVLQQAAIPIQVDQGSLDAGGWGAVDGDPSWLLGSKEVGRGADFGKLGDPGWRRLYKCIMGCSGLGSRVFLTSALSSLLSRSMWGPL